VLHGELARRRSVQMPSAPLASITEPDCTQDPAVAPLLEQAVQVLDADIAVLVLGETGVGKEVFARQLHGASRRGDGPFVAVNCAALPESLIESELFGYEDGAFTGARRKGMAGRVREADGGVLFLDEIGDMPLPLQARLLRVLQEREVTPLGGGRPVPVDFALICATVCDLQEMVDQGAFRPDLFYRIQDFSLTLPPLRARPERAAIIKRLLRELGGGERRLSFDHHALQKLLSYDWPGNLRQLTSVLRTLVVLTPPGTVIGVDRLPVGMRSSRVSPTADSEPEDLRSQNLQAIEQTLEACNGCVSEAARRLGIHRSTIYRQLGTRRR
jgi:transcriptional regulator of acetoin/glycerol metabolism